MSVFLTTGYTDRIISQQRIMHAYLQQKRFATGGIL